MYMSNGQRIGPIGAKGVSKVHNKRKFDFCLKAAIFGGLGMWSLADATNPAAVVTSTDRNLGIQITSPSDSISIFEGEDLRISGRVSLDNVTSTSRVNIVYLVDVSASTDDGEARDCNNDGIINDGDNFAPDDSFVGTILDCEVGALMVLNDQFSGNADISASIVAFGSRSVQIQPFTGLAETGSSEAINVALRGLVQGGGSAFTGSNTDYVDALRTATELLRAMPVDEQRVVYLLSDGANNRRLSNEAFQARDAGVRIEVFSFGENGDECNAQSELSRIALTTGGTCRVVNDPGNLAATVSNLQYPPNGISRVEVRFNGSVPFAARVDRLGVWDTTIVASALASGANTIEATVFDFESTQVTASVVINAVPRTMNDAIVISEGQSGLADCVSQSSDPDGDGYGWENNTSCIVTGNSVGDVQLSVVNDPEQQSGNSAASRDTCVSSASDPDRDGYGWENNSSCIVTDESADDIQVAVVNDPEHQTGDSAGSRDTCVSSASDPDGDGYGWENGLSCIVSASLVQDESTNVEINVEIDGGSGSDNANPVILSLPAVCTTAASDYDNDGWGWENNSTCIVTGSAAVKIVD